MTSPRITHETRARAPREIAQSAGTADPAVSAVSNAVQVLDELTSSRRLATLSVLPTREQILSAIDATAAWRRGKDGPMEQCLRALRSSCEGWTPTVDVPSEIAERARMLMLALGYDEPPAGWEIYDGYPETWEAFAEAPVHQDHRPQEAAKPDANAPSPAQRAADLAQKMTNAVNLIVLFAAPKIVAQLTEQGVTFPPAEHVLSHMRDLIDVFEQASFHSGSGLSPRPPEQTVTRVRALEQLVERWDPAAGITAELREAARSILLAMGIADPPGGWDAFEGPACSRPA